MTTLTGRCFCGQLRWTSPGPVLWAGHCHCESCRRATSAPFTSFVGVERDSVTWTGEAAIHDSSPGTQRGYCPRCGSQMFYHSDRWADQTHLYAASLDDPRQYEPKAHFHWAERVPWLEIEDDLPKYEGTAGG